MGYDYGFDYGLPDGMEGAAEGAFIGAAGIITGLLLVLCLVMLGFWLVSYVLNAVGMYRIAKRRGIHHAWLAWIPVGCNWLLGSISDHYQYVAKRKVTKRRKILLILSLVLAVVCVAFLAAAVAMVMAEENSAGRMAPSIAAIALMAVCYLIMLGLEIAILVFCFMAYYDLFRSCKPDNAVLYLVLSILFSVVLPFFVFFSSDQDKGMPARRTPQPAAEPSFEPTYAPTYEPEAPAEEEIPAVEAEVVEDPEM